jgi:D-alanyl-D-alanine carboxypeptidase (penicillin-binding protein 5/6)
MFYSFWLMSVFFVLSFNVYAGQVTAEDLFIEAKSFVLIDYDTGFVISEKNSDYLMAPGSLAKMMTSYIIGKQIDAGNISLDDKVVVSNKAWSKNFHDSSKMFIRVGDEVTVRDLNYGIVVSSANDACVAIAEHISGSEDAFVLLMNEVAQELGMLDTFFVNSHGLDADGQMTTAMDVATLAASLIRDTPKEYLIYKQKHFTFNNIKQYNLNSMLWYKHLDVDGLKAAYTKEVGYSLVSSVLSNNMRLISVVIGADSNRSRLVESRKLLKYGFMNYISEVLIRPGVTVSQNKVWKGTADTVRLGVLEGVTKTFSKGVEFKFSIEIE